MTSVLSWKGRKDTMKKYIDFLLKLIKAGRKIHKAYRKAKNARRKEEISKAVRDGDANKLRDIILG